MTMHAHNASLPLCVCHQAQQYISQLEAERELYERADHADIMFRACRQIGFSAERVQANTRCITSVSRPRRALSTP